MEPVDRQLVVPLVLAHHYSRSCANTAVAVHGLFDPADRLVGGALWMPPTKNAAMTVHEDWRGVLALSRLVIEPSAPTNAASFLLGASMRLICRSRWPGFVTYADTAQGHTGAIYRATNWTEVGPVPAGDTWRHTTTGEQRGRKRGPRNWSKDEMHEAGFVRVPPAPKIKFVHLAA